MKSLGVAVVLFVGCIRLVRADISFEPVVIQGKPAVGLPAGVSFNVPRDLALADNGQVVFSGSISGPGVNSTNNECAWAGLPGDLHLVARTGQTVRVGSTNLVLTSLLWPAIDNAESVGLGFRWLGQPLFGKAGLAMLYLTTLLNPFAPLYQFGGASVDTVGSISGEVSEYFAARVELSGGTVGTVSNIAIVSGPISNVTIVAQQGAPAPGVSGKFTFFNLDSRGMATSPDGQVVFTGVAEGLSGFPGLWQGKAGAVQAIALRNAQVPESLLGTGYTFGFVGGIVAAGPDGQIAYTATIEGPGVTSANEAVVIAGKTGAWRLIARGGQAAVGISSAFFRSFGEVLIGLDGSVAFVASYSTTGYDYGLWLAPPGGGNPVLIMHTGQQAPGTPAGVVFTSSLQFLPGVEEFYLNAGNQIVFRSRLSGPGIGNTNNVGIWLAQPNGSVSKVVRAGEVFDIGGGAARLLNNVSFGPEPELLAGPADGRRSPFNDRGEILFSAGWQPPIGTTGSAGMFIVRSGFAVKAMRSGTDILLTVPTSSGAQYRVDYTTNFTPLTGWSPLIPAFPGTGNEVTVTDTNATSLPQRFYRAVKE